mmetsp:Transcript_74198/g.159021  ORF Transcript_74198/g.159021 Transcript_74198/m.159021 type:complete len:341 (-) Transcript_74198:103-1125(-)
MAAAMAQMAPSLGGVDTKTELNQFCQRFCQRPVTKQDIVYTTSKFGQQFQSIVRLNCLGGQEYAGNLSLNPKEAEKYAAQQALQAYATTIASLPPSGKADPAKKRKVTPKLTPAELAAKKAKAVDEGENPAITPKTKLNSLCMKIAKRYLQKGETVYDSLKVAGGYQATVKLTCLPGVWSGRLWAGQVCSTKQKAEQSAAEIALAQIVADKELSEEAAKPKGNAKGKGGGKGAGKGKGKGWGWGSWGWGPPWAYGAGAEMPRERVSEETATGEVVEWKDNYGWVKPHAEINHPAASQREGKVYVNKKDLSGVESLTVGQAVKFYVYEDPSGLGGEEVTPA